MLCEMGFLFDMLEKADGQSCQATNFLKTYSMLFFLSFQFDSLLWFCETLLTKSVRLAANLGTLDHPSHGTTVPQQNTTLDVKVQAASRFLLEQIAMEWTRVFPGDLRLDKVRSLNKYHPCELVQKFAFFLIWDIL